MGSEMKCAFVWSDRARILNPKSAIHPHDADIVDPRHAELNETLWFHQLLRDKGVLGVPIENGRQTLHRGADGINEFMFVIIAALRFADQQVCGFETSFETNVPLSTEERFVFPGFGCCHRLMDTFLMGNERSLVGNRAVWGSARERPGGGADLGGVTRGSFQKDQHGCSCKGYCVLCSAVDASFIKFHFIK